MLKTLILPRLKRKQLVMSLFGYFDESGKLADSDFVCIAGYLSDESRWNVFTEEWAALLTKYQIPSFHTKVLIRRQEEAYKRWSAEHVDRVLEEFVSVIRKNVLVGFGVGIDTKHLRSMKSDARQK